MLGSFEHAAARRHPVAAVQTMSSEVSAPRAPLLPLQSSPPLQSQDLTVLERWLRVAVLSRHRLCAGCAATDEPRPGPPLNQLWKRRRHDITGHGCGVFVYTGPLSQAVKNLKVRTFALEQSKHRSGAAASLLMAPSVAVQRLSIGGCVASVFGSPILVLGAAEAMPPAAQASIIATISGFGLFTTGASRIQPSRLAPQVDAQSELTRG